MILTKKLCSLLLLAGLVMPAVLAQEEEPLPSPVYVPSPQEVVDRMLEIAKVTKNDVLYDLGCGDGRIVITAAKLGARAVGVDINPERIKESLENAKTAGVTDRVTFRVEDLFTTDVSAATVVTLYLLPSRLAKLRPKLLKELKPGTRIVAHDFDLGDWSPDETFEEEGHSIFFWRVPAQVAEAK